MLPLGRSPHRPRTEITPYIVEKIRQLSAADMLQSEIATSVGVSVASVGRVQRNHGIPHPSRSEGRAVSLRRRA